ncbi:GAF and ANTAR domain-containing protein [Amycolatopsis acidiphila]|uniref:GAF and ANTAR domain-containing protein n=1 Tax=Amycolatopsis acidiphila TaxID=715473 RepID=A0A558ABX9_9PSEU|nr:GAF and ANTAR domain-containing protein [Amycolatopsis acidiphila]TVT21770.1 GAF and ANTAR domain-containing protein [Amycolatopsis acidiphila]UIJ61488.1 GAF and ANTAR domain-containing protein [Amycolatopsis acidiphila]GHG59634.1 transcriptional regulator [Amycolatopsis acidiphila]
MSVPDARVTRTFVELADTLVADFDLIEFLHLLTVRCVDLLGVEAAGLLLANTHGVLNVVAASGEQVRLLELLQLQNHEGAAIDCYREGRAVQCPDLTHAPPRWPVFARAARDAGFLAVVAVPMRLRNDIVGAVNLFAASSGELGQDRLSVGQALADIATIGILHERTLRRHEVLVEQLQTALTSRITIEQAKGVLAERLGIGVDEAFVSLRMYARSHRRRLAEVATSVVERLPEGDSVVAAYRGTH